MAKIGLSRKANSDLDGIWDYTVETWSEEQAAIYYRQIHAAILGLHSLPAFLEIKYDIIKPGLLGHKVGHHILFYKKHDDGSIWIDRILHDIKSDTTSFSTRNTTMVPYGLTVSSMKEWITKGISEPPRKAQKNQGNSLVLFVTD